MASVKSINQIEKVRFNIMSGLQLIRIRLLTVAPRHTQVTADAPKTNLQYWNRGTKLESWTHT